MLKATYIPGIGLLCAMTLASYAQAADLASRDWSVKASPSLTQSPPTSDDVRAFVNKMLSADMNPAVCNFKFVDFPHDGTYRLTASLDASGRHFCNELVVIGKQGSSLTVLNQWKVWEVDDIGAALQDVDHDGRDELVLPQNWAPYEGATHCLATWQTIYQWDNGKFIDHSVLFPDFYKKRREQVKTALDASMGYGNDAPCQQMEMDKIDRFLMSEPHAGFTRAEDWMKSPDSSLRRKAAAVFADIGDPDSKADLTRLSTDPNSLVAETAKMYLEKDQ